MLSPCISSLTVLRHQHVYCYAGLRVFLPAMYSSPSPQESSINACHNVGIHSLSNCGDHHCACGCVSGSAGVQTEQGSQNACGESRLVCMPNASCHMCAARCGYASALHPHRLLSYVMSNHHDKPHTSCIVKLCLTLVNGDCCRV